MTKYSHLTQKKAQKKVSKKSLPKLKVNIKTLNITLSALIFIFGMSYMIQVNGLVAKGYQIKELEGQVQDLEQIKSDLELEALSLQSMGSIKEKVADLDMVEIGQTQYLDSASAVAVR